MNNSFYLYLIIMNIIGFAAMLIDKQRAIKKQWRISEKALLGIALLGGSLGVYIGMQSFRHKTKHKKFTVGVPIIIVFQLIVFPFFFSDYEVFLQKIYLWFNSL